MKVIIADDHALFRDALKAIIYSIHADCTTFEAATLQETLHLSTTHPDAALTLIDLHMPGISNIENIEQVHKLNPDMPLVVVSMYDERDIIQKAFTHGASGYIPKTYDAERTRQAISIVLAGKRFIPEEILSLHDKSTGPHLTRRQQGVLKLILKGYSNQDIADELYITLSAVKMHVGNIMKKHNVKSRVQLITAHQNRL